MQVNAKEYERRTIYHSPQTPGFTSWVGLWMMPDSGIMASFTQATGPTQGWRPRAPENVRRRFAIPNDGYDMTGLALENVYLRSDDRGKTWDKVSSDPFVSVGNGCVNGGVVIEHGQVLRSIWGQCLPFWDVPQTGYFQRSTDGARTWGPPEPLSNDAHVLTWPKRVRVLADGRIVVTGGVTPCDGNDWKWMELTGKLRPCLWVSSDKEGRKWSPPLYLLPVGSGSGAGELTEEVDVAELKNGDLLAVYRRHGTNPRHELLQLARKGNSWEPKPDAPAMTFPQSGHPELLAVREGVILYVSHAGIWWTADSGAHWSQIPDLPAAAYYPRSVQLADGTIMVIGHVGYDDAYGKSDQSIVMDTFRIIVS